MWKCWTGPVKGVHDHQGRAGTARSSVLCCTGNAQVCSYSLEQRLGQKSLQRGCPRAYPDGRGPLQQVTARRGAFSCVGAPGCAPWQAIRRECSVTRLIPHLTVPQPCNSGQPVSQHSHPLRLQTLCCFSRQRDQTWTRLCPVRTAVLSRPGPQQRQGGSRELRTQP